jgi:hypothetical protein
LGFSLSLLVVEVGERSEVGAIEGVIGGTIVGLVQTLVLSQWFPRTWLWILVNAIAWGLLGGSDFGTIGWYAPASDVLSIRLTYGVVFGSLCGLWLGIWQWIVLRKYLADAWRWIGVNLACWAIALPLGWTCGGMLRATTHLFLGEVVGLILTWLVVSTISAMTLARLLGEALTYRRKYGGASSWGWTASSDWRLR